MTKKLEETFNMDPVDIVETMKDNKSQSKEISKSVTEILSASDVEQFDEKMDEYSTQGYNLILTMTDLANSSEPRHASEMVSAISSLLKTISDAQNAKIDKKIKLAELDLRKKKFMIENKGKMQELDGTVEGTPTVSFNREELLKKMSQQPETDEEDK